MKCSYEECDREIEAVDWCKTHYNQQWRGVELKPIKTRKFFEQPTPDTKICTKCMTVKTLDEFYTRPQGIPQSHCKECMRQVAREYEKAKRARILAEQQDRAAGRNTLDAVGV